MFWSAVRGGLAVLAHWQAWVVALGAATVFLTFQLSVAVLAARGKGKTESAGCFAQIVGGTVIQGIVLSFLFALVTPIVMGGDGLLPTSVLMANLGVIAGVGLAGVVAGVIAMFIPGIGQSPAVIAFIQGVVICRLLLGHLLEQEAVHSGRTLTYPGLIASLGFLAIAWVVSRVILLLLSFLVTALSPKPNGPNGGAGVLATTLLQGAGQLVGCIPVFMYMRYAAMSVLGAAAP